MQATKYRIYPTRKQERKFLRYIHASRYAYNTLIDYQGFYLEAAKAELLDWSQAFISEFDGYKLNSKIRKLVHWINRSVPVEIVRDGLGRAVASFHGRWKHGRKYPKQKKYQDNTSFGYSNSPKLFAKGNRTYLKVPGRMDVEVELHKELPTGKIKRVTISRDVDQWFASVAYETEVLKPYVPETVLALDDGLTSILALSTGEKVVPPKPMKAACQRVRRLQRSLSNSQKGSKRYKRKKHRLACAHRKVRRIREYHGKFLAHRITQAAKENQALLLWQDTHIAGMLKNHRLAGAFADVGIGQFKVWLTQQCDKKGIPHELFPRLEKTSGMCPMCSTRHDLKLSDRSFICCGVKHDRDIAAAQYMQKFWLDSNQNLVGSTKSGRGTSFTGCQPSGLGVDRRLGLKPPTIREIVELSDEPSMELIELEQLPDVATATVEQNEFILN